MFKTNEMFNHQDINDIIPEVIYYYLFKGLSLTAIEEKLFGTDELHGWFSKCILNYFGIDTGKDNTGKVNKGIYDKKSMTEVVETLTYSTNIAHNRVAKILKEKYL